MKVEHVRLCQVQKTRTDNSWSVSENVANATSSGNVIFIKIFNWYDKNISRFFQTASSNCFWFCSNLTFTLGCVFFQEFFRNKVYLSVYKMTLEFFRWFWTQFGTERNERFQAFLLSIFQGTMILRIFHSKF